MESSNDVNYKKEIHCYICQGGFVFDFPRKLHHESRNKSFVFAVDTIIFKMVLHYCKMYLQEIFSYENS